MCISPVQVKEQLSFRQTTNTGLSSGWASVGKIMASNCEGSLSATDMARSNS